MLRMYLPSGGPCPSNKNENYTIIYDVVCDNTEPFIKVANESILNFDPKKCTNIIEIRSRHGINLSKR